MENARALDERLRKIIREVGNRTGGEIKRDLLQEFELSFSQIANYNSRTSLARTLTLFKQVLDEI